MGALVGAIVGAAVGVEVSLRGPGPGVGALVWWGVCPVTQIRRLLGSTIAPYASCVHNTNIRSMPTYHQLHDGEVRTLAPLIWAAPLSPP
jgi:hypothetical protein